MNPHKRSSSIHKIRDLQLETVLLREEYDILRVVGEGSYGKVQLALHRQTGCKVALKSVPKQHTKFRDFLREFHYSYFLSPHLNILITYDVAFQTPSCYVFAQEYAPFGDLGTLLKESGGGLEVSKVKTIVKQVASALDFMHSKQLVHRDIKPQNILVFDKEASQVKLTDFGLTCESGTLVKKSNVCMATMPPEICEAVYNEGYHVETNADVWQLAMLIYRLLTGVLPWDQADITDSNYMDFVHWQKRKTTKIPRTFKSFSPRMQRLFRRVLEPKPHKRAPVKEVFKYFNNKWFTKTPNDRSSLKDRDSDSASQRSDGVNGADSKANLGLLLSSFGVDVKIDRDFKRKRVHEWILSASP